MLQSKPVNPKRHSHLYPRAGSRRQFCVLVQGSSVQFNTAKFQHKVKKILQLLEDITISLTMKERNCSVVIYQSVFTRKIPYNHSISNKNNHYSFKIDQLIDWLIDWLIVFSLSFNGDTAFRWLSLNLRRFQTSITNACHVACVFDKYTHSKSEYFTYKTIIKQLR